MRDMKRGYFLKTPLTGPDFIALDLNVPEETKTPSGTLSGQVTVETYLVGWHELGIRLVYITGNANEAANKGYLVIPTGISTYPFSPNGKRT
ncbi:hypothetical protein Holit_02601 [Hollandina sp. SP2]